MPITSSAINLREIVCRVYKREKDRAELTWRRACLVGAQEHGDQRWHNPSDEERSTFHAVGVGKTPLDLVLKDERLRMIVHMNGWYERARTEVRKQESKDLRRSPFKKTTWEVMRDAFVEAARHSTPGFWRGAAEDMDEPFSEYCEWLVTGEGTPDAKTHEAFGILDGIGFRDELWTRLDNECREEAPDIGLGEPPGGEGAAQEQPTGEKPEAETALTGDEALATVNKMLQNEPAWSWKQTRSWLGKKGVTVHTRESWRKAYATSPPMTKGRVALVNESELHKAIRGELQIHDKVFDVMDKVADCKSAYQPGIRRQ